MIKLNLDAFARRAVPWRCTRTYPPLAPPRPGGHTTEAACCWSIRRGRLPPRRRLVTEDGRLDTSAVGELLAGGDVARREEGDVRQRLVAVLGQHAARGHVGLVARAVDEAGGVARVERIDGRRARRMPAPRQRQEGAAVGAVRRLLGLTCSPTYSRTKAPSRRGARVRSAQPAPSARRKTCRCAWLGIGRG